MTRVSRFITRVDVSFDDPNLVANAGLLLTATMAERLGLEAMIDATVKLGGRTGGARTGRKMMTLTHAMIAGGTQIDHADMLRAGSTAAVLGHRVMAPSTLGTFLRSFTFRHVRQLEAVNGRALERAWATTVGPVEDLVIDVDSTICEDVGKHKQGAGYGYTRSSAITRSWPLARTPVRSFMRGCGRDQRTLNAARAGSSTNSSPAPARPERQAD